MPKKKQRRKGLFDCSSMRSKKQVEKDMLGDLSSDGKEWMDEELDEFFDLYFAGKPMRSICRTAGRSESGIATIVWKVAEQYRGLLYTPGPNRVSKAGKPVHKREIAFLRLCKRSGKTTMEQAAAWCGRTAQEIEELWRGLNR